MVFFSKPLGCLIFFFSFCSFLDFFLFIKGTKLKNLLEMVDEVSVPSPDLTDPTTLMTNFGATLASDNITPSPNSPDMARSLTTGKVHGTSSDISSTKPLGHQSGIKTGGTEIQDKVLWCNNLDLSYNYRKLFELLRKFGPIERMKVVLTDKSHLSAFITFF